MMNSPRWDDLKHFLAVAETGTLKAAGERLEVDSSTVHRRIAALEVVLGATLFRRDPRGYELTAAGEALRPHASDLQESVLAALRAVTGHDQRAAGDVTITMPETFVAIVAPILATVRAACPQLKPIVRTDDRVLDLGSDADIAIRPSDEPPEAAVGRRIASVAWAVYATGEQGDWIDYAYGGPPAVRKWMDAVEPGQARAFSVSSVGAMPAALRTTGCRGLLPCYLGDGDVALTRQSGPVPELTTDLWLLIHADLRRAARVRALLDILEPALRAQARRFAGTGE